MFFSKLEMWLVNMVQMIILSDDKYLQAVQEAFTKVNEKAVEMKEKFFEL